MFDVIVIGGGPGGYKAAELLGKRGFNTALVEEKELGGVCLNQGCIPFKSYLHVSKIGQEAMKANISGMLHLPSIDVIQENVLKNKNSIVKILQSSVKNTLQHWGVKIYYGKASVSDITSESFSIAVGTEVIEGHKLIIATGSIEKEFTLPPHCSYKVMNSKELLELDYIPNELDIIGAGAIGLEAASYFADAGSKVSVIEAVNHIGGRIDSEISRAFEEILVKKGIDVMTNTFLLDFGETAVHYQEKSGHQFERKTAYVLVATGRIPRLEANLLNDLGVEYTRSGIQIDDQCRTTNKNVYACGDVTGKLMLAHTAYQQAKVITSVISGRDSKMTYDAIPRIIYSNPEILSIGVSEEEGYEAQSLPMTYSGKYFAENGKDGARAKIVLDRDRRIIGFHMIGNGACELSLVAELMIREKMSIDEIGELVYAHPTYGEILGELAGLFA